MDFLAGYGFTPEAMAAAPVATEAKKPMIVMNAALLGGHDALSLHRPLLHDTPAGFRPDGNLGREERHQDGLHAGLRLRARASTRRTAFTKEFEAPAARSSTRMRTPLRNPDFAPFIQRIKDAKPNAVFVFCPAGEQSIAFMKAFAERGLARKASR